MRGFFCAMRAIIYIRVSTVGQADSGLGLAAQERSCRLWCQAMGYEVVGIETDAGVSTRLPMHKREGLSRAMQCVRSGGADVVVAADVSRISRNTIEFLGLVGGDVPVITMDLGINPATAVGRFLATILAANGQLMRDLTSEKTVAALAEVSAQGRPLGARAHLEPVLVPADVIARMRALKAQRLSTRTIARQLTAEGFRTPRGGHSWSHSTVAAVLSRDVSA